MALLLSPTAYPAVLSTLGSRGKALYLKRSLPPIILSPSTVLLRLSHAGVILMTSHPLTSLAHTLISNCSYLSPNDLPTEFSLRQGTQVINDSSTIIGSIVAPLSLIQPIRIILDRHRWSYYSRPISEFSRVIDSNGPQEDACIGSCTSPNTTTNKSKALHLNRRGSIALYNYFMGMTTDSEDVHIDATDDDGDDKGVDNRIDSNDKTAPYTIDAISCDNVAITNLLQLAISHTYPFLIQLNPSVNPIYQSITFMLHLYATSPQCRTSEEQVAFMSWHTHALKLPLPRFTFCEIFSGIGGFRLGLETNLGGRCVFACDISKSSVEAYTRHFGSQQGIPLGDINVIDPNDIEDFTILTAGFPCQSYCRQNSDAPGLRSENGQVFHNVIKLLLLKHPDGLILENVPNLLYVNNGNDFKEIIRAVERCGYDCDWKIIDARPFVPQQRRRLYIVGIRRDLRRHLVTDSSTDSFFIGDRSHSFTSTLTEDNVGLRSTPIVADHTNSDSKESVKKPSKLRFSSLSPSTMPRHHNQIIQWSSILPPSITKLPIVADILESSMTHSPLYHISLKLWTDILQKQGDPEKIRYRRLVNVNGYAKTLVSTYKSGKRCFSQFVPSESKTVSQMEGEAEVPPRLFTPRECCRLMGFPESFHTPCLAKELVATNEFYHHIGNAVIPQVVERIAALLLSTIETSKLALQTNALQQ